MGISFIASSYISSAQLERDQDAEIPEYTIGIEDVLSVFVWKEEELSMKVVVRPDGKISFPLVSDIAVEGLTCQQLEEKIRSKLLKYIKEPKVTVIADEINSFKASVLGEVNRQGVYVLKSPLRLLEILAMAEGLNEFANKSDVVIIRKEGDKQKRINVDYRKIITGVRPDDNVYIKPGDTIIVN
jgi:polysaccharide export outer membrane protein